MLYCVTSLQQEGVEAPPHLFLGACYFGRIPPLLLWGVAVVLVVVVIFHFVSVCKIQKH